MRDEILEGARVRLGHAHVLLGDDLGERRTQGACHDAGRDAVAVGDQHQEAEVPLELGQRRGGIRECRPMPRGAHKRRGVARFDRDAVAGGDAFPDLRQPGAEQEPGRARAHFALHARIGLQDLRVGQLGPGAQQPRAREIEHALLEVDQGANQVEGEDVEIDQAHGRSFVLLAVTSVCARLDAGRWSFRVDCLPYAPPCARRPARNRRSRGSGPAP